jgi:hypothetical protein
MGKRRSWLVRNLGRRGKENTRRIERWEIGEE